MADRISSFSDELLCYLSLFSPNQTICFDKSPFQKVETSMAFSSCSPLPLFLWQLEKLITSSLFFFPYAPSSSLIWNLEQPIQKFCLTICPCHNMSVDYINSFVGAAMFQGRLQHLEHLDLGIQSSLVDMSPNLSCCKTLTVLKLQKLKLKIPSSAHFPIFKVMHLKIIGFFFKSKK